MTRIALQRLLRPDDTRVFTDGPSVLSRLEPDDVDILRFGSAPLKKPSMDAGSSGLARTELGTVPVWQLSTTRVHAHRGSRRLVAVLRGDTWERVR